jgi:hypothetical protein
MKQNDILWKAILEDIFDDFLLFFFKEDAGQFDFDKGFVFLDKELEQLFPQDDNMQSPKFVDKLVKVFTKAGKEEWILVHVEVQGYTDSDFAKRMFTYFYRIFDHYEKLVTCVAIFTDRDKRFKPSSFTYDFLGTKNVFSFNTYKVINQDERELQKSNNPFAIIVLTVLVALQKGKVTEEQLFNLKFELAKTLLQKNIPKDKIRSLMNFLRFYVRFDNPEIMSKFESEIETITDKHTTMGIEEFLLKQAENEGMEKAIQKRDTEFVKSLLTQTEHSVEKIARLVGVSVSFVEKIKASLSKP